MRMVWMAVCAGVVTLGACVSGTKEPSAADIAQAQTLRPQDQQLAERYERSCMACHAVQGSGAPLTGFAPQWSVRAGKGMAQLVEHTYEGFNAMPARGLCNDCTRDDFRALIHFMSGGAAA